MPTRVSHAVTTLIVVTTLLLAGCVQERASEKPPIHINPNMDKQPKYRPQDHSGFFADGATMRVPVEGTVARGELRDNSEYYIGRDANGELIKMLPDEVKVSRQLLLRGRERYDIYCAPCHGRVGDGKGIIVSRGLIPPPRFHSDNLRGMPDGHIFDVISNGIRNMPAYRYQIPVDDRWAIVAYFRALQKSQNAGPEDIPKSVLDSLRQETQ